jgi:hypothetical protein
LQFVTMKNKASKCIIMGLCNRQVFATCTRKLILPTIINFPERPVAMFKFGATRRSNLQSHQFQPKKDSQQFFFCVVRAFLEFRPFDYMDIATPCIFYAYFGHMFFCFSA